MRVFFDANLLVQIFARRGKSLAFRELLITAEVTHLTSHYVLNETEAVMVSKLGRTRQKARSAVRLIAKFSAVVNPTEVEAVSRDPHDNPVLAAAAAGRADYLVTSDKDLLVLKAYRGVRIITPEEFDAAVARHTRKPKAA